jgi:uncharacterized DUF497 family protein
MLMTFRWNEWNLEHVAEHGVTPEEAESVVTRARQPFPMRVGDDKWLVWGSGRGGRLLQVIFVLDDDKTIFVLHARPLTEPEKKRYRRRKRK